MDDLINRQALLRDIEKYHLSDGKFQHWVEVQPSVEAEPVVRCKDCAYCVIDPADGLPYCPEFYERTVEPDDYCSKAVRK